METDRRIPVHEGLIEGLLNTMRIGCETRANTDALQNAIRQGIKTIVNPINTSSTKSNTNS